MLEGLVEIFEDTPDWKPTDSNQDSEITGDDIPYEPGSIKAKAAWKKIEAIAHSPKNIETCKTLGYENGRGMYGGKVLAPGAGPNQGDFDMLRDKLIWYNGYSPETAVKIAGKTRWAIG